MSKLPEQVSDSTRRRNPHLWLANQITTAVREPLRQSSEKRTQAEIEFGHILRERYRDGWVIEQSLTFTLGNGVRYTPDFFVFCAFGNVVAAYEVKGARRKDSRWFTDDARVKIKVAAAMFPWLRWSVVWKEAGVWQEQIIKT